VCVSVRERLCNQPLPLSLKDTCDSI